MVVGVGIGNPDRRQNFGLERFHRHCFPLVFVIEADEMQDAVHDEMLQMMRRGQPEFVGLADNGFSREYDVTEEARFG